MRARVIVAALTAAVSWGCSSGGAGSTTASSGVGSSGVASASRAPSRSQDVIGEAEIKDRASDATNAMQIVQKLRPQMLRSRGVASPNDATGEAALPKVVVDYVPFGTLESLSNVSANQIKEIRFIKGPDATTHWGTGYLGGVISVTTKK